MVKLIKVARQKDLIKVNDNGKEKWYDCEPTVKGFINTAFKQAICNAENKVLEEGDEIVLSLEKRGEKECVIRASKPGQAAASTQAATQAAAPAQTTGKWGQKTPEQSETITRLSVMSSAAEAAQVLTGQINDPNVLAEAVILMYRKMLAEIKA